MKSKKYAKRLLSFIIASVMIVTMLPVSALAAGVDDVMIEDQAETIVEEAVDVSGEVVEEAAEVPDIEDSEDAAIVDGAVDEIAEAETEELTGFTDGNSLSVEGVLSGSNMQFDAQLAGLSVSAVVPVKRAAKGSVMTADIVDVSAYEDAVAEANYGNSVSELLGLELHFYDKKGKEIKHINTSEITVTIDGFAAQSYYIGRIESGVNEIQKGTDSTFTFKEKKAYTYVIAGLVSVDVLRMNRIIKEEKVGADEPENRITTSKSVTDEDNDGIYDLKLKVQGTSNKSQSETLYKSNVVVVIDNSLSMTMNNTTVNEEYIYNPQTYSSYTSYYTEIDGRETQVYHDNNGWYYNTQEQSGCDTVTVRHDIPDGATIYTKNQGTRLAFTKEAAKDLVTELLKNNKDEDNKRDIIEISVIKFNSAANTDVLISKSTDEEDIHDAIDTIDGQGWTNWEKALIEAKTEIDGYPISDPVLPDGTKVIETNNVIFLTDGLPTQWLDDNGNEQGTGYDTGQNIIDALNNAMPYAPPLVNTAAQDGTDCTFYTIFAYGDGEDGINYLKRLTNYAYYTSQGTNNTNDNDHCFDATDTAALQAAFKKISDKISSNIGFAGVEISDGLSVGSTNSTIAVDGVIHPEYFVYTVYDEDGTTVLYTVEYSYDTGSPVATFKNAGGTALTPVTTQTVTTVLPKSAAEGGGEREVTTQVDSVSVGEGADAKTYMMSPATIADDGMIDWNLSGLGILERWTYELSFKVWPNQAAYDIAADLNNGFYNNDLEAAINDYISQGRIKQTEGERLKTTMQKVNGQYVVTTNYSQGITYHQASVEQKEGEEPDIHYESPQSDHINPDPDPIPLTGSLIPMEKRWESGLAIEELQSLVFDENDNYTGYYVKLHLAKDGDPYQDYTFPKLNAAGQPVDKDGNVSKDVTKLVWHQDAAIAPGRLVKNDPGGDPNRKKVTLTGTVATAAGIAGDYYIINDGHEYKITEEWGEDLHFEYVTDDYHPMIVDGQLMNIKFASVGNDGVIEDGSTAEVLDPEMTAVYAKNILKGGLTIQKVVLKEDRTTEVADSADEFTFEIQLMKEGSPYGTPSDQYSLTKPADYDTAEDHNGWSYDETHEFYYKSGFSAYSIFSGKDEDGNRERTDRGYIPADGKLELTMPANGEIRVVNLPSGVTYTVEEKLDVNPNEYHYLKTKSEVIKATDSDGNYIMEGSAVETTDNTVTGTITGNKAKLQTYYNWAASFYVYHSSDNTIEKISFADPRVKGTYEDEEYNFEFNIVNETKSGYLYGGYYKSFGQQKATDDQITGKAEEGNLVYTTDSEKETETEYDGKHKGGIWAHDAEGATPYTGSLAKAWKATIATQNNVYTAKGTEMTPSMDTVYYLKEVPDSYLKPYMSFVYHTKHKDDSGNLDYPLVALRLITAVDDANYSGVGFYMNHDDEDTQVSVSSLAATLKITNSDGTSSALTAKKLFVGVPRGYLSCSDQTSLLEGADEYEFTMAQYFTTLDGVTVEGNTLRTINIGNKKFVNDGSGKGTEPGIRLVEEIKNERWKPNPLYY